MSRSGSGDLGNRLELKVDDRRHSQGKPDESQQQSGVEIGLHRGQRPRYGSEWPVHVLLAHEEGGVGDQLDRALQIVPDNPEGEFQGLSVPETTQQHREHQVEVDAEGRTAFSPKELWCSR